ncbi:NYN domain-containing protein [Ruegeria pomeroyi]|nr:NYN domain-containing protein [Ruegeria pomeroyi]
MKAKVAVFADGDNIGAAWAQEVLGTARQQGSVDYARVYLDVQRPSAWADQADWRLVHAGRGKNAADLLLSLDAMELALTGSFDCFVIASSDGDFAHLARRLREIGKKTVGIGEVKAPDGFRSACSLFVELEAKSAAAAVSVQPERCSKLDRQIRSVIAKHSKNGQGMALTRLAPLMHQQFGTRISQRPERTWRGYLSARPDLYDLDAKGTDAMVRFLPAGFAGSELGDLA